MKCPSCATPLVAPLSRCPECRLSLQRLDVKFGMVPRHSRYLSDRSGALTLPQMEALREELRLFEKKFPQSLLSVLVTDLPRGHAVAEYAFWMANRARFSSLEKTHGDNYDLLLVIDVTSKSAAFTTGYGLEPYVDEDDLQDVLNSMVRPLREGELAPAIQAFLKALTRKLRERSATAKEPQLEEAKVS